MENNFEQDLLILLKGTALIIETKASKLREPFRDINKAVTRLKDDFKVSIQYGYDQCMRLEKKFKKGVPFILFDKNDKQLYTINPSRYHTVLSIVVTLERFGSLQTDLGLFFKNEPDCNYPWSVYIDDLETFLLALKNTVKNPEVKLIQFLKQRILLHKRSYAVDELDVCGNYLSKPSEFSAAVLNKQAFVYFSPKEQAIFDDLYYSGKIKFNESVFPTEFLKLYE